MATLCGFMAGSLYKVWPFQIDKTPEITEFKHKIFQPIFIDIPVNGQFWGVIGTVIFAGATVLWVEHFATRLARKVIQDDPIAGS